MSLVAFLGDHTVRTVALGAALLGVVSGVLGAFTVLRRQSLLGDALAHAALPGICLAFLITGIRDLPSVMAGAFLSGGLAALVIQLIGRRTRLKTDAALGIVLSVFFAAGVVLLTVVQARGGAAQAGLSSFLFGQAAAMLTADLWVMGGVAALAVGLVTAFWKEFKLVAFDPAYARTQGLPVVWLEGLLTVMSALAIVVGLQMVGVVLMTAMLIAPAAAARQWVSGLGAMVWLSAAFGVTAGVGGALISAAARGVATGPVVVLIASALVLVSMLLAPRRGLIRQALRQHRHRLRLEDDRVLATLDGLGREHDDPAYPAGRGMLDAAMGAGSDRALARLEGEGLVRAVTVPPETVRRWELTESGRDAAARLRGAEA